MLASPANGSVLFAPRLVGTIAKYSCNEGNLLKGIPQRVCQQNGTWSGDEPSCLCESDEYVFCENIYLAMNILIQLLTVVLWPCPPVEVSAFRPQLWVP